MIESFYFHLCIEREIDANVVGIRLALEELLDSEIATGAKVHYYLALQFERTGNSIYPLAYLRAQSAWMFSNLPDPN